MSRRSPEQPLPASLPIRPLAAGSGPLRTRLRHVGYSEAEELCAVLAQKLRRHVASEELEAAELRAIPRGGLIVAGMLSYQLGLHRDRLRPGGEGGGLVVLVDDCALSGLRLRQEMELLPSDRQVIAVHLLSAPELRRAVVEAEPRIRACLGADDLADYSRSVFPDPEDHAAWRERFAARLGSAGRYWIGLPEPIAFAWSEPDRPFWNSANGRIETGWRFQPPHRCLKSRAELARGLPSAAGKMPPGPLWQSGENVVWSELEDAVWLCRSEAEQLYSLDGSAALIWKALVTGAGIAGAAAALAALYDVDSATAAADVEALAAALVDAGLVERIDG